MKRKSVPPSVTLTAFSCPHCGTLTTQFWHSTFLSEISENGLPFLYNENQVKDLMKEFDNVESDLEYFNNLINAIHRKEPLFGSVYQNEYVQNFIGLSISKCMECKRPSLWFHDKIIYPQSNHNYEINDDIPVEIRVDIEEASKIINLSPRGAAALLRLALQKLLKVLGGKGKNINDDIAHLVRLGIDPIIHKSLDIVRVVGNEAVHPGVLDIKDDVETADALIQIINVIAERCITYPKKIENLYNILPPEKLKEIERRNGKST